MTAMAHREIRLVDSQLLGHSINSGGFFASTNLLLIAAVASVLFGGDQALQGVASIGEAAPTRMLEAKLALVMACLARGLLDFIWSMFTEGNGNRIGRLGAVSAPVDTTAPTISITSPVEGSVFEDEQQIEAGYHCADEADGSGLATWLGTATKLRVKVAEDGEPLVSGTVYLAPDDKHLGVTQDQRAQVSGAAPIQGFRPSANWLFRSVAHAYGRASLSVVLTGMGQDGLDGIRDVHQAGGHVLAQDEATSVIYGMPGVVVGANLAHEVLPLGQIARRLQALFQPGGRTS